MLPNKVKYTHLAIVHGADIHQVVVPSRGEEVRGLHAVHGGPGSYPGGGGRHGRGYVQLTVHAADCQNLERFSRVRI